MSLPLRIPISFRIVGLKIGSQIPETTATCVLTLKLPPKLLDEICANIEVRTHGVCPSLVSESGIWLLKRPLEHVELTCRLHEAASRRSRMMQHDNCSRLLPTALETKLLFHNTIPSAIYAEQEALEADVAAVKTW